MHHGNSDIKGLTDLICAGSTKSPRRYYFLTHQHTFQALPTTVWLTTGSAEYKLPGYSTAMRGPCGEKAAVAGWASTGKCGDWGQSMFNKSRFLVLILFLVCSAFAEDRGTIRGVVTDPSGAAVPETAVTVKNVATGLTQTVKTSADGVYSVLYLPAGEYIVTVAKAGFRKAETTGVQVHVATVSNGDVTLTLGGVDQSVEVIAAAPLLDVQGTTLGKVIPKNAIKALPLFIN